MFAMLPRFSSLSCPLAIAGCLLCGCTVGPDYQAPEPIKPEQPLLGGSEDAVYSLAQWWEHFQDPTLSALITQGLANAPTLQAARERLISARASREQTEASFWPQFTANGSYTFSRGWEGKSATKGWDRHIGATADARWEIDIFGGLRREQERAEAEEAELAYTLEDLRVSLAAEIATAYVNVRRWLAQCAIAEENLALQEKNLERIRKQYENGEASRYDFLTAEAQVANTRASLPTLRQSLTASGLLLDKLSGLPPYASRARILETTDAMLLPEVTPKVPQNELLRRRADVRTAEETVHTRSAAVGVAVAALYPSFALNESLGLSSPDLSPWNSYTRSASLGPSVSWNIFGFGTWRKQVESAKASLRAAVADYQDTVLLAYQEAETAWRALQHESLRTPDLRTNENACKQALEIADSLYKNGSKDIEDVLTRQRSLLTAQEALVEHRATLFADVITLYKALGGGWSDAEPAPETAQL